MAVTQADQVTALSAQVDQARHTANALIVVLKRIDAALGGSVESAEAKPSQQILSEGGDNPTSRTE